MAVSNRVRIRMSSSCQQQQTNCRVVVEAVIGLKMHALKKGKRDAPYVQSVRSFCATERTER